MRTLSAIVVLNIWACHENTVSDAFQGHSWYHRHQSNLLLQRNGGASRTHGIMRHWPTAESAVAAAGVELFMSKQPQSDTTTMANEQEEEEEALTAVNGSSQAVASQQPTTTTVTTTTTTMTLDGPITLSENEIQVLAAEPSVPAASLEPYWCYWSTAYELIQAGTVGAFTGLLVAAFKLSIEAVRRLSYEQEILATFPQLIALIPAFGGILVGLLLLVGGPYPPGLKGTIAEVDRQQHTNGENSLNLSEQIQLQANFLRKSVASVATLGTGCSLGPEGPCVEIGINVARACTGFNRPVPSREAGNPVVLVDNQEEQDQQPTTTTQPATPSTTSQPQRGWNRVLLSSGAAAGVAAGFNAPLSGVFFALEIMQNAFGAIDEESEETGTPSTSQALAQSFTSTTTITPILIASVLSALTSQSLLGEELVLKVTQFNLETPLVELPLYLALGALSGVVAFAFSYTAKLVQQFFNGELGGEAIQNTMKDIPKPVRPIIGGLLCGLIGLVFPQILFFGYDTLNSLLKSGGNALGSDVIATLLGVKLLATALAAGSGLVGGTFAPSLFLGAMLGALFHNGATSLLTTIQQLADQHPETINAAMQMIMAAAGSGSTDVASVTAAAPPLLEIASVPAYTMVGAASVLAALFRAPLTASLLLFEITRDYDVILPLLASAGISSIVADILEDRLERQDEMQRRDKDPVSWGDLSSTGGKGIGTVMDRVAALKATTTTTLQSPEQESKEEKPSPS